MTSGPSPRRLLARPRRSNPARIAGVQGLVEVAQTAQLRRELRHRGGNLARAPAAGTRGVDREHAESGHHGQCECNEAGMGANLGEHLTEGTRGWLEHRACFRAERGFTRNEIRNTIVVCALSGKETRLSVEVR